jgi:predicted DsbA family dithiol-disulfide isomerase
MTAALEITLFTDPACPFAFSAEPVRWMLRWQYGDQLRWRMRMIVLTREPGEAEKLAEGADGLQRRYGMPIARGPHARLASCEPACRAVVAARLHAPEAEESLLRRLRVRTMAGGLIDDPDLLTAAASDAGLEDPERLIAWSATDRVAMALEADAAAARSPSARARALDHRLSGPRQERRYSAPSYELRLPHGTATAAVPGCNPVETYEIAFANLEPGLIRRPPPTDVRELMRWAGEPLATAEIAAVMRIGLDAARDRLEGVAQRTAAGADAYWSPRAGPCQPIRRLALARPWRDRGDLFGWTPSRIRARSYRRS